MTMAAAIESRTAEASARSRMSRIARVDIVTDLGDAEPIWRRLEYPTQLFTPYQQLATAGRRARERNRLRRDRL